ncbi:hypothetical protein CHARACLAT_011474 [Characodon lateralis]|uniref:Uncharacterized protein n=1 Tax=Characodon lateralis TaxID=208331 RepID=A0ABU7E994_9TELE|nr:hypothetical protein [Characodon lateralis]
MRVCEELAASPSALDCNPSLLSRLVFSDVSAYADILLLFVPCSMLPCGDFRRALECSWISSHVPPNNNFWLPASMAGTLMLLIFLTSVQPVLLPTLKSRPPIYCLIAFLLDLTHSDLNFGFCSFPLASSSASTMTLESHIPENQEDQDL